MSLTSISHKSLIQTKRYPTLIRFILNLSILFLCASCASIQDPSSELLPIDDLLNDQAFPKFKLYHIEKADEIFALSTEAKAFVRESVSRARKGDDKIESLMLSIFDHSDLDLTYLSTANTSANDTFLNRSANCLSLSIMTYAMALEAGFTAQFQIVNIPEFWTRRSGFTLLNSHLNLRITRRPEVGIIRPFDNGYVVDFDPQVRSKKFMSSVTDKETVLAMYYNNKGADALLQGDSDLAYAYFREAVLLSKSYSAVWTNLGFLYRKVGFSKLAHKVYRHAIAIDEDNNTAWENLAFLYDRTGDFKAAADIRARLESKRMKNPFYHQMLAQIDEDAGSLDSSVLHYERAIRLDKNQHQFYFGLASVYFKKGKLQQSRRFLQLAKRKAGERKIVNLYANKLDALSNQIETSKQ